MSTLMLSLLTYQVYATVTPPSSLPLSKHLIDNSKLSHPMVSIVVCMSMCFGTCLSLYVGEI